MKVYDGAFITLMYGVVDGTVYGRGDGFVVSLGDGIIDGIGDGFVGDINGGIVDVLGCTGEGLSFSVRDDDEYDEESVVVV